MQDRRQETDRDTTREISRNSPAPRRARARPTPAVPLPRQHRAAYATLLSEAVQKLQDAFGREAGMSGAPNRVPVRVASGRRRRGGPAG